MSVRPSCEPTSDLLVEHVLEAGCSVGLEEVPGGVSGLVDVGLGSLNTGRQLDILLVKWLDSFRLLNYWQGLGATMIVVPFCVPKANAECR